uniref:WD repeat-containing protein 76 n=1 Tax=Romanomermis culicivorax TaxID=13658 RepID=A0A915JW64_ROMCU
MVELWDIRKTSSPLYSMEHSRSVRSSLFSPLTGQHILTTSLEDTINVWTLDTAKMNHFRKTLKLNHNNKTGRWLTPFSAIWHPKSENYFMCGSLDPYRHVDIFSREGRFRQSLPVLTAVCSLNGFHPSYNMAIGLNSITILTGSRFMFNFSLLVM